MGSSNEGEDTTLSPDEAFSVLGNETRIEILQTLGDAGFGESLSFSELRDRVGIRRGGEFNYHLDKLVGHFVAKTDEGYALRPAGARVVEAVLSGAVTGDPDLEPVVLDAPCPYCDAPVEMHHHQGRLHVYCTECQGTYGHTAVPGVSVDSRELGYLGAFLFPPAGIVDRSPEAVMEAATIQGHLDIMQPANDLCGRCAAVLETTIEACTEHDTSDGLCSVCGYRHGIRVSYRCTNCVFDAEVSFADWLLTEFAFVSFLVDHGVNPVAPTPEDMRIWVDYDEEIRSIEPFEAHFTFTIDEDVLRLTVDDDLNVVQVTDETATENSP